MIQIKRIYDSATAGDGYRVLVDRLWPRGISKERAHLNQWYKAVAPSKELRVWYGHVPERFPEFERRYTIELVSNPAVDALLEIAKKHKILTLLYAAKSPLNEAVILKKYLDQRQTDKYKPHR